MAAKKNSLVANINARKRAGKSRPKSRSTVDASAYEDMKGGWPKKSAKKNVAKRKSAKKTHGPKKKSAKKTTAKKRSAKKTTGR